MVRWAETKLLLTNTRAWRQYQQVCFVELHKIMSLTWKEQVTDHSIYFSPSVVKSNKSDLKIMNQFMFLARGIAGALNVLFFMETPWNNIFLLLAILLFFFCFPFTFLWCSWGDVYNDQARGWRRSKSPVWWMKRPVACLCRYRFVKHIPQPSCFDSHRPSQCQRCAQVWC